MHQKYDLLVDKGFKQRELMDKKIYFPKIIQDIKNIEETSSKNGISDKELFMTECGPHT